MRTVSQMMEQKRQAKAIKLAKASIANAERIAKKSRDRGLNDYIPLYKWQSSSYGIYLGQLKNAVQKNKLIIDDIVQQLPQLHRLTFFPCGYDFRNIRKIIEGVFQRYVFALSVDEALEIKNNPINIHYKQRELLSKFIDVLGTEIIPRYTSRLKFAQDNSEMIINHELYCKIGNNIVTRFSDWEGVAEAKTIIQTRIDSKATYQQTKQNLEQLKIIL